MDMRVHKPVSHVDAHSRSLPCTHTVILGLERSFPRAFLRDAIRLASTLSNRTTKRFRLIYRHGLPPHGKPPPVSRERRSI